MNAVDTCRWSLYFTIQFLYRQLYLDVKCACLPGATSSNACGTQEEAPPADPWAEEGAWLKRLVTCLPTSYKLLWVVHLHLPPNQQENYLQHHPYEYLWDTDAQDGDLYLHRKCLVSLAVFNSIKSLKPREGQIEAQAPEASLQLAAPWEKSGKGGHII